MNKQNSVKYGLLHVHTEESLRDSAMSCQALIAQAKKLGAPAIALTDHGVMTGYISFMQACKDAGIKPILGVEMYVEENDEGRKHLIVMAKNNDGFHALIKAVTQTNLRMKDGFPRASKKLLIDHFGPGTKGHGNVIATSACVSGVLSAIVLANQSIDGDIQALRDKQSAFVSPDSDSYLKNLQKRDSLIQEQTELSTKIALLKKTAEKKTRALEKRAISAKTEEKRSEAKKALEEIIHEKEVAAAELERLQPVYDKNAASLKTIKAFLTADEKSIAKWSKLEYQIKVVKSRYIDDKSLNQALINEGKWYDDLFGHGNFYIELQNHGLDIEEKAYPKLAWLSDMIDVPVVAANDAHMPDNSSDSILARAIIRSTRFQFQKWNEPQKADKEMYLKSDEELFSALTKIIPVEKAKEAMENVGRITSVCDFELHEKNHYPKFTTPDDSTAEEYLEKKAREGILHRYGNKWNDEYEARLQHELNIVCSMGYADYLCIVEDFLQYARAAGKLDLSDPEEQKLALTFDVPRIKTYVVNRCGEYVGPGRGSAAGSIVCYLTGITNIDPMAYGLLFERFLNPDRVSMPDIDCDIETEVRPYVVEYVKHKYGIDSVCGIMTKGTQSGKAALLTAAKTYALKKGEDSMYFIGLEKEIAKVAIELAGDEINLSIRKVSEDSTKLIATEDGNLVERKVMGLKSRFASNKNALEIIHFAECIEGTITQFGQHAAGIIVTDGNPVDDFIPLIMSNRGNLMTSCDMNQAEKIGLLKIDFLGLKNLTIISNTLKQIYRDTGIRIDMDLIPIDDADVYREIFSKANTNSVFQFESDGMKSMLREMKPESIFDLIQLVAMFRPGPLQYLPDVIAVKNGKKTVAYKTPELRPILSNTYGAITYQEQVQEIFKQLAGYSLGQADLVRRAMSKKKESILEAERHAFINGDAERNIAGCAANGINPKTANTLFDEVMDFSKYCFNKSHAACYAVVAYQTAWLKYHYPLQYMCAVLNSADFDDVPKLCDDIKYMKLTAKAPDLNISKKGFTIYDKCIYFGLGSIKGMGDSTEYIVEEREKNGSFRSIADFIIRTRPSAKIYRGFVASGVFDGLCSNRKALLALESIYAKYVKDIKDAHKKVQGAVGQEARSKAEFRLKEKENKLRAIEPDTEICDNTFSNLQEEKKLLGEYLTGHPLDYYPTPEKLNCKTIQESQHFEAKSRIRVMGIISNLRLKNKKADGKPMGFFNFSDITGTISVACFTKPFASYGHMLADDQVVIIEGQIMVSSQNSDRIEKEISVERILEVKPEKDVIIIMDTDPDHWQMHTLNKILPYSTESGNPVQVYFSMFGEFRNTDLILNPQIVDHNVVPCSIQKITG